jgi:cytochrome c-type biogenesis protein CcmH/NrfG
MGSFARVIYYLEVYLTMHPDDSSVMFSLAALYMKEDNFAKSRDVLLNIIELYPDNKEAANLLEEVEHNLAHLKPAGV